MSEGRIRIKLKEYLDAHPHYGAIRDEIFDKFVKETRQDITIDFTDVHLVGPLEAEFLTLLFQQMRTRGRAVYLKGLKPFQIEYLSTKMRLGTDDGWGPYSWVQKPKPHLPGSLSAEAEVEDDE